MIRQFRILVIDDDPGIRETYREILSDVKPDGLVEKGARLFEGKSDVEHQIDRYHYQVILKKRGDKGIEAVEAGLKSEQPICLIFIDMSIPGKNGAETAKQIWQIDKQIKIVFVTAFNEYSPDEITSIVGRDDIFYLRKPFNPDEIRQFARALTTQWFLEAERQDLNREIEKANQELEELNDSLHERVEKQTAMLVQSDKMASLGILTSGIAQKLNLPVSVIEKNLISLKKSGEAIKQMMMAPGSLNSTVGIDSNSLQTVLSDHDAMIAESMAALENIEKTITNLKTISKSDDTTYRLADIHEIIDTTLNVIYSDAQRGLRIKKEYADLPQIWCFPQKLSQAILNLLVNAVQSFQVEGLISIQTFLEITGKRVDDRHVRLVIEDNGCGIPPKNLEKLFDPFFTTKPVGEGTGLGLSIVYDIIKLHRGDIKIESQNGLGTKVTITLPVKMGLA